MKRWSRFSESSHPRTSNRSSRRPSLHRWLQSLYVVSCLKSLCRSAWQRQARRGGQSRSLGLYALLRGRSRSPHSHHQPPQYRTPPESCRRACRARSWSRSQSKRESSLVPTQRSQDWHPCESPSAPARSSRVQFWSGTFSARYWIWVLDRILMGRLVRFSRSRCFELEGSNNANLSLQKTRTR